ncbi:DUF3465 domain-containing protein [Neptuniibacter sp. 1_MG-2023]|jgi:hypothetical protein|uniref:DUF3465 domain-containing protein n=1 Tax=Neptuniibacter sp. 1_MG-2023 TaxID=3062662 RepID=UPI0026E2D29A|nr:DUF3465 domain-containing protein [Neptuniibacter sp. 1_MG-2023]MDO6594616.1 DUF3465 domain-containing protein [Neptuniibacter sp. 1_MG-2023]
MKKLILLCLIGVSFYAYLQDNPQVIERIEETVNTENLSNSNTSEYSSSDRALARAFKNKQSDLQIGGSGKVVKVLADDLKGSRHQKFILELSTGQTLLVAHNIDLAPRINGLSIGDRVKFFGEYEWSARGGVMHWTHHDPQGRHEGGWLLHNGNIYQ